MQVGNPFIGEASIIEDDEPPVKIEDQPKAKVPQNLNVSPECIEISDTETPKKTKQSTLSGYLANVKGINSICNNLDNLHKR